MPKTMRALAKIDPLPGLKLIEALVPTPGPGEVLVRVKRSALSTAAVHIDRWDAWAQRTITPPVIVGQEFAGLVATVGPGVTDFHPGELVVGEPGVACGSCRHCLAGHTHLCAAAHRLGQDRDGAFADYVCVPQSSLWHADPRIPIDVLACFTPLGQAIRVARRFDLLGAHVVIGGAGSIGCLATAVARHAGARSIVVLEANPAGLALARSLGATHTLDTKDGALEVVRHELGIADGFDLAIEAAGTAASCAALLAELRLGGELALLAPLTDEVPLPWTTVQAKQLAVHGFASRHSTTDWGRLTLALQSGLAIEAAITHRLPFSRFREAFDHAAAGAPGKIVLEWDS